MNVPTAAGDTSAAVGNRDALETQTRPHRRQRADALRDERHEIRQEPEANRQRLPTGDRKSMRGENQELSASRLCDGDTLEHTTTADGTDGARLVVSTTAERTVEVGTCRSLTHRVSLSMTDGS
jgi:hypothetical protein